MATQMEESGQGEKATLYYAKLLESHPGQIQERYRYAKLLLDLDRPSEALQVLEFVQATEKKYDPIYYYLLGQAYQGMGLFSQARMSYKSYLQKEKDKKINSEVYLKLKQTWIGVQNNHDPIDLYIENLGGTINTKSNEIGPIYSPNFSDRLYFSSNGSNMAAINRQSIYQMYGVGVQVGKYDDLKVLDEDLVQNRDQILYSFSQNGMSVYYSEYDGSSDDHMKVHTVTDESGININNSLDHPVFSTAKGDRDLYFVNDSTILFSSNLREGLGGYDIYIAYWVLGKWKVENLGPDINSSFDEITPFITKDGRNIYFSANGDRSMGDYDVLQSTYDDDRGEWGEVINLGKPINSGKDDVGFRWSPEGNKAILASNRPNGYGQFDLYEIFFENIHLPQIHRATPPLFYQVPAYHSFKEVIPVDKYGNPSKLDISDLYYTNQGNILSAENTKILDEVIRYHQFYPHLNFVVKVYSSANQLTGFSLYNGYLRGQMVSQYLTDHNVSPSKLKIWSFAGQYQVASTSSIKVDNVYAKNNRIEIEIVNNNALPFKGENEDTKSAWEKIKNGGNSEEILPGLYYRVKLMDENQVLKGSLLADFQDVVLERKLNDNLISYYSGIYPTFALAKEQIINIKEQGFKQAAIVAFDRYYEILRSDINVSLLAKYPDLKNYLIDLK